jgi:mannitol-1-/sugar-/sorbitol-6-/2-deoxyglucose-6-phosphatase
VPCILNRGPKTCALYTIFAPMKFSAVIFDMDGLLIDSEPLWQQAGTDMLQQFGVTLTEEEYNLTTGLRTPEWVDYWFTHFSIDKKEAVAAAKMVEQNALDKIKQHGIAMPGVEYIMQFFKENKFQIGLASSSPMRLIETVVEKLNIRPYLNAITSAEQLPHGKPHPQVFLNCAELLNVPPTVCVCFEDSFNGMIAAKAARMKCVVIPAPHVHHQGRWDAADCKLNSLLQFNQLLLEKL